MSIKNRVIWKENGAKISIQKDTEKDAPKLWYRYVKLSEPAGSESKFSEGSYDMEFTLKKGEVLEMKEEGEDAVFLSPDNYHPRFSFRAKSKKGATEITFSTNPGLNLSRVRIEDPQKRIYYLATNGTLEDGQVWYLPPDAMFSKNPGTVAWHILLDAYSAEIYDYLME